MARASNALKEFIKNIPDDKLRGFPTQPGELIYKTSEFRLDMHGVCSLSFEFEYFVELLSDFD